MTARITDKIIWKYVSENKATIQWYFEGWQVRHAYQMNPAPFASTPRKAAIAAIKAERKRGAK